MWIPDVRSIFWMPVKLDGQVAIQKHSVDVPQRRDLPRTEAREVRLSDLVANRAGDFNRRGARLDSQRLAAVEREDTSSTRSQDVAGDTRVSKARDRPLNRLAKGLEGVSWRAASHQVAGSQPA